MSSETLILGNYLIMSPAEVKKDWGVLISGTEVQEVGRNDDLKARYPQAQIIQAQDKILAPGFINGHYHIYGVLSHGITVQESLTGFDNFLEDFWWPQVENRITRELAVTTSKQAAVEMIRSGVTTFCDILEAPNAIPGALEDMAKVMDKAGLRGILSFEACERVDKENGLLGLKENENFVQLARKEFPLLSGLISIHTTFTCSPDFIKKAGNMARENNCLFHMHLSESKYEPAKCHEQHGMGPVDLYESLGVLGPNILASQGVKLEKAEIAKLAQHNCRLVHMPLSNCEVGGGIAPVPEILAAGIDMGLGSDGYINDFFAVMRGAFLLHKAAKEDPGIMPADLVYDMATRKGAQALGYETGEIRAGKPADLIAIDTDLPTPVNENNIFDQLVLFRKAENVSHVMVNGKLLMKDKELLTLDEEKIRFECRQAAEKFWQG